MEFHLFHIITSLMLVLVGTNAAIFPPQYYWKSKLPNSPMPKAITDLLHPAGYWSKEKATMVDVSKGGVDVGVRKVYEGGGTYVNDEKFPFVPLFYLYALNESQIQLHGTKLNLQFRETFNNNGTKFLPREVANSIPFSSNKLENIFNKFSIKEGSKEAEVVKRTISECEANGIKGEEKLCVTSLESMVDFTISKLGNNVEAISTEVNNENSGLQQYVIAKGVKKLSEKNKTIVCHKENYPYAVFYCHKTDTTEVYYVALEGVDGSRVKSIVVCHTDTSEWNPKYYAFHELKVQPGTVPVCHTLPQDHVVWVSK